jgi:hypothetical protein
MLKFDIVYNEPALDLPLSQQAKVINFNHLRTICYRYRFWCNRRLNCYKISQGTALDSEQRGEAMIKGLDVID